MKISPSLIVVAAVILSVASAGIMLTLNYDALFKPKPIIKAEFTSVEFDADDTSYEAEDAVIQRAAALFQDLDVEIEVRNQARVHLWYEGKFGKAIPPFQSIEHAVSNFPTTATAIAVHPRPDGIVIVAPFGLDDLFDGIVRPNKAMVSRDRYEEKIER